MNASSFITFVTYMLRQNCIRFYKGLYVTFKLTPDLKKKTVYLLSYSPLNEGHIRSQTCKCKKGSDWLKRWVEAQHNIFKLKVFHDWSIIKLGNILYLLDRSIFAVPFGTTFHCLC